VSATKTRIKRRSVARVKGLFFVLLFVLVFLTKTIKNYVFTKALIKLMLMGRMLLVLLF
jgi:hypothetical protein